MRFSRRAFLGGSAAALAIGSSEANPVEDLLKSTPIDRWQAELTHRAKEQAAAGNTANLEAIKRQCETLIGFTEYRFPRYRPATHQRFIAEQLERVERGEIDRLMLLMPPRHGKSELASKSMPAWSIGRKPWRQFISATSRVRVDKLHRQRVEDVREQPSVDRSHVDIRAQAPRLIGRAGPRSGMPNSYGHAPSIRKTSDHAISTRYRAADSATPALPRNNTRNASFAKREHCETLRDSRTSRNA
jgi:hypothetical protein